MVRAPRLRWRLGRAALAATALAATALTLSPLAAVAGGPAWSVAASFPPNGEPLNAVSCWSSENCVAVGSQIDVVTNLTSGVVLTTSDGGQFWSPVTLPSGIGVLNSVSCVGEDCVAVGGAPTIDDYTAPIAAVSADGGATWAVEAMAGGNGAFVSVSCGAADSCAAVGAGEADWTTNGTSWSASNSSIVADSVQCQSATACDAFGEDDYFSSDGGQDWSAGGSFGSGPVGNTVGTCVANATTSSTDCYAATAVGIFLSTDGGTTWNESDTFTTPNYDPQSVFCQTATACIAAYGSFGSAPTQWFVTQNVGESWNPISWNSPVTTLAGFSCSGTNCQVVGAATEDSYANRPLLFGYTIATNAITTETITSDYDTPEIMQCPTATTCYSIGQDSLGDVVLLTTTNAGVTWSNVTPPANLGSASILTCPTALECIIIGVTTSDRSESFTTETGGATWRASALPNNAGLSDVACATASVCVAVAGYNDNGGSYTLRSTNGGVTWSQKLYSKTIYLSDVSCGSSSVCVAVGYNAKLAFALYSKNAGVTWSVGTTPKQSADAAQVQCATATTCLAVGSNGNFATQLLRTTNGGTSWSLLAVPKAVGSIDSFSCVSGGQCEIVGQTTVENVDPLNDGLLMGSTNYGTTWSNQGLPTPLNEVTSVACAVGGFCAAGAIGVGTDAGDGTNAESFFGSVAGAVLLTLP